MSPSDWSRISILITGAHLTMYIPMAKFFCIFHIIVLSDCKIIQHRHSSLMNRRRSIVYADPVVPLSDQSIVGSSTSDHLFCYDLWLLNTCDCLPSFFLLAKRYFNCQPDLSYTQIDHRLSIDTTRTSKHQRINY